ncbi:MAG: 23S rRNA (guanosine(2251)-2'-O)-methyltransferase RlmB [Bacteroidetes bacterium]|nr:23S rRNA (guanosine(2251)-2'-O)-methyltransferase RlmB [Bacteroidota bacterium]
MAEQLIFGVRPVIEAIEANKQIDRIYIKKGADSPHIMQILSLCQDKGIVNQFVPMEKLNKLTRNNHQGVVAQVSPIEYFEIEEIVETLKEKKDKNPLIVVMDSITDIRNFGAIARSAECAGADAIIMPKKNSAPVNGDAVKSSAGALTIIPICRVGSIRNTLRFLVENGMQLVAATEKSEKTIYDADLTMPTVLIMGSEDKGISKEVLKLCDITVAIPMLGKTASLNVSAAAAVILFETLRQRR